MSKEFEYFLEEIKKMRKNYERVPETQCRDYTIALLLIEKAMEKVFERIKKESVVHPTRSQEEYDRTVERNTKY